MAAIETQRAELQKLYLAVIAADGISGVHRLLSEALIKQRHKAKRTQSAQPKKPRKPRPAPMPRAATIMFEGQLLKLGEAMRKCTVMQQLFVLHHVRKGLGIHAAEKAAGYAGTRRGKGEVMRSVAVRAAIIEERARHGA